MGIKERQERDREAVRRAILDAARDLFVSEGYQNVSIRKIAERIEYSPAAIYSYFPSKDDIFFALAEEGLRLLHTIDVGAGLQHLAPLERIRSIFRHLYAFSCEHPQYFALLFLERSVPRISREYERFATMRDMKTQIAAHVQECIDARVFPAVVDPLVTVRLLLMAIVGVVVMRLSGRLASTEDADALASDMLDVVLAGLQSGVTLRARAGACPVEGPSPVEDPSGLEAR